ncbi:MAG: porin [Candidatus Eremiobacteraeota bacterium]|nr:porin [Candidatus Eremiobacteraeota bacterium]
MPPFEQRRARRSIFRLAFTSALSVATIGALQRPAQAAPTTAATASPAPVSASDIADLKAQMDVMRAKLDLLESQQAQQAAMALDQKTKDAAAAEVAKAKKPVGTGVHIVETAGTDVRLYGLIEGTLAGVTNASTTGQPAIGLPVSWFSGNRWGIDVHQRLSPTADVGDPTKLNLIVKLESEFELPSGNMDTPGVLFNRDAWMGVESQSFGKLTLGRQDTLPRDVSGNWGDPYGVAENTTNEGNYTNTNDFKQFIFYTSGGNGAGGQGDTRYDSALVYKKIFANGIFIGAAYNFGDDNGPGGPNGSGPIAGGEFNHGSTAAFGLGINAGGLHASTFYNTTNVIEAATIGTTNVGHEDESVGVGGNYDWGKFRMNAGFIDYTGDQGKLGRRMDYAWTTSARLAPTKFLDYELGVQEFYAANAAVDAAGFVMRPYTDASTAKSTIYGSRFTIYGSVMAHPVPNVDVYLAGDDLLTGGNYLDSRANGHKHQVEEATGVRYKF